MSRRVKDLMFVLAVTGSAVGLYYVFTANVFPGIPAAVGDAFSYVLPGLIVTSLAALGAIQSRGGITAAGSFCLVGVGLALILYELDAAAVINAAMLAPATLEQVQVLVIITGFILGVVAYSGDGR
jgi:hypothetical protein